MSITKASSDIPEDQPGTEPSLEIPGVKDTVAYTITRGASVEPTKEIDCLQFKREHSELIVSGANGVEVCKLLGERFSLPNWARGEHHGEWQTLSTPEGDLTQLKTFLKEGFFCIDWSLANGGSDSQSIFHLTHGVALTALLGKRNLRRASARNNELINAWGRMGELEKEEYLKVKIGLDIKGDWEKLTGLRAADGSFGCSHLLCVSGPLSEDGKGVLGVSLNKTDCCDGRSKASDGRICFLG